ncbi:DUF4148 domain-containing protein [Paraburkholderia sp. 31.1]|uniref:DUF4148 domain-containing protein n=1 Tax=Paraburkholderia sp. 31.1 TaxID=2615205 RepID=UPI001655926F|nr:DUF4148 domain-containing protein [Paraburkholderia sp. 31.1]
MKSFVEAFVVAVAGAVAVAVFAHSSQPKTHQQMLEELVQIGIPGNAQPLRRSCCPCGIC